MADQAEATGPTGPRTTEGKAIVRRNAIKHGILSNIVPEHEQEAYPEHVAAVHASYQPVGYMEEALTERISTSLWRLGRVVRYESGLVTEGTSRALGNLHNPSPLSDPVSAIYGAKPPEWPDDQREQLKAIEAGLAVHLRGPEALKEASSADLHTWLLALEQYAYKHHNDDWLEGNDKVDKLHGIRADSDLSWTTYEDETGEALTWTPEKALKAAQYLMSTTAQKVRLPAHWDMLTERLEWHKLLSLRGLESTERKHVQLQAENAVPSATEAGKIAKYEAHLERTLYRAMHELEAMQERRAGNKTPLARVDIHGVEGRNTN